MSVSSLVTIVVLVLLAVVSLIWLRRSRAKPKRLDAPPEFTSSREELVVEKIEINPAVTDETPVLVEEPRKEATLPEPQPLPEAANPPLAAVITDSEKTIPSEIVRREVEIPMLDTTDAAVNRADVAQNEIENGNEGTPPTAIPTREAIEFEKTENADEEMPGSAAPEELSPLRQNESIHTQPTELPNGKSSAEPVLEAVIPSQALSPDDQTKSISRRLEEGVGEDEKVIPETVRPHADTEPQPDAVTNEDEPVAANDNDKTPQRYRPPSQAAPRQPKTRTPTQPTSSNRQNEVLLDIRLRLTFDRFGFCRLALLPERKGQLDDEVTVRHGGIPLGLTAQEDWYQDLEFPNIGELLRDSIEMKGKLADNRRVRWLLTARNLYVLASHQRASGFVSTTRMTLGRSHIVLCTAELQEQVEAILIQAGCTGYAKLQEADGMPTGWIGYREVAPTQSLPLEGTDAFYAIKPAPDIEINLDGGIWLHNSVWLAGYPPKIKLLGQANTSIKVLIDGKEAQVNTEGYLITDGYDSIGQHSIYCEGLSCSRTYSIEEPSESWEGWSAYKFDESEICGPLVQLTAKAANRRPITVPMSTPLLLGAEPGQIFRCSSRSVTQWKGFVPFDVVWALPAYPLRCNKKTARILQFKAAPFSARKGDSKAALDWCNAILDASRKGLRVESNSAEAVAHWHEYKKEARKMWRAAR
jgi:hypothetical protein